MQPVGDKLVVQKRDLPERADGIILSSAPVVLCEVLAAGKGIPYGRGEFYELSVKQGDLVLVTDKTWREAPAFRVGAEAGKRPEERRVLHEREILTIVEEGEL